MTAKKPIGSMVFRKPSTRWKAEGYTCHPCSFGVVVDRVPCDESTRPQAMDTIDERGRWEEILVAPFSPRMALDRTWIQWVDDERLL